MNARTRLVYAMIDAAPAHLGGFGYRQYAPAEVLLINVHQILLREWGRVSLAGARRP